VAIESVTGPNCGASGIQIDTAREHSFCSYCGSTVRTKDVFHLDMESMALEKLKRNAQRSFEVRQYGNARADWAKAIQLDRTDHESYWGVVCCDMATQPYNFIQEAGPYGQALAYAPSEVRAEYVRQMEAHNNKALKAKEARDARAEEIQKKQQELQQFLKSMRFLKLLLKWIAIGLSPYVILSILVEHSSWPVLGALFIVSCAVSGYLAVKIRKTKK